MSEPQGAATYGVCMATLGPGATNLATLRPTPRPGPFLIRPAEVHRVERCVDEAIATGGRLTAGGHRIGDTLFEPSVVVDPPAGAKVSREEIFGPVVCLYGYDDVDVAIAQANDLPYAFQAAVFTERLSMANHCVQALAGSTILVNDHTAFRVDWMPFAGLRQSGLGTGGIGYSMADMTQRKMAVWKWPRDLTGSGNPEAALSGPPHEGSAGPLASVLSTFPKRSTARSVQRSGVDPYRRKQMIRVTKHDGNLVELTVQGTLEHEDYEKAIPEIESATEEGNMRMLVLLRDFSGWEPKALLDDLKFDVRHRNDFRRVAIVGEKKLEEWATKLSRPLFSGEMKYFDDEARAREWVRA